MLASSLLLSLALAPDAVAGGGVNGIRVIVQSPGRQRVVQLDGTYSLTALTPEAEVASVSAELDGEPVSLTESDAWVHGAAALGAVPAEGATVTLTVYATDSAPLASFSGSYAEGELTLLAPRGGDGGDCYARVGCESSTTAADLDVLAAAVFADGTVGIDLAGADALSVASATLSVVTSTETDECLARDRAGTCIEWGVTTTRVDAEVDLDDVGILWESEAVALEGVATVTVEARDGDGRRLDRARLDVAAPWDDGGAGVSVLPVDEDPLTTVALHTAAAGGTCYNEKGKWFGDDCSRALTVLSDGWTLDDALPAVAEVEVEGGEPWSIPANSYQRAGLARLGAVADFRRRCEVTSEGGVYLRTLAGGETAADGTVALFVTAYGDDAAALPTTEGVTFTCTTESGATTTERATVTYDPEIAVVFALDLDFAADPHGLDLVGSVELQGEADARGRRRTLVRGGFAGQLGVDGDGEPALGGIDDSGATVSRGDILIGGEPIDIELEVEGEVVPVAPPVIVRKNGKGTRTASQTTQTQQTQLL